MPVPVSRTAPWGNVCDRHRYPASSSKLRLMLPSRRLSGEHAASPSRMIVMRTVHVARFGFRDAEANPRPERARAVVDLRLRQIQEVLAFDVARAHVVADRAADDLPARVDHERKLRLRHAPRRVAPNADRLAGRHDFLRQRLEENLGPLRVVDPVVRRRAEVGLLHARGLAAQVRHAGSPHFLPLDRRAEDDIGDGKPRERLAIDSVQQRERISALQH